MNTHTHICTLIHISIGTHTIIRNLVDLHLNIHFNLLQFEYGYELGYLILKFSFLKSRANDNFAYIGKLYVERKY